jgi:hypothetical protein
MRKFVDKAELAALQEELQGAYNELYEALIPLSRSEIYSNIASVDEEIIKAAARKLSSTIAGIKTMKKINLAKM